MKKIINSFFKINERKSSIKLEILAGITSFLAMAYILTVNPNNILFNGTSDPRFASVFIATALGAFFGTILMAFLSNMPLALAPGMGLNTMVGALIGGSLGFSFSYGNAMFLVFISGLIFLFISFVKCGKDSKGNVISLREKIFDGIPPSIRNSISVGIGLFIAFIGLQNAHIIVNNDFTLLQLVDFNNPELWSRGGDACYAIVALFGLLIIGILSHYKVKGSIVFGIMASTILAIPLGVTDLSILSGNIPGISWKFWENIGSFININSENSVFLSLFNGFNFPHGSLMTCITLVLSFSMIEMFDTIGTVVGCCQNANLLDEKGKPLNYSKIMYSDSMATLFGALFGTSSVTIFVESGAGVSVGGKTGLTAVVTALLFLLSIFILPVFAFIPTAAAASALIYVGVLMMKNVNKIDFENTKDAIVSFVTILIMLLSYSITDGIGMGIIVYVLLDLCIFSIDYLRYIFDKKREKPTTNITLITLVIFILFLIYFLIPTKI